MLVDIRNAWNPTFWLSIVAAACVVDTAGLFVWRYTSKPTAPINRWYDQFGLVAYGADILSIVIGVILTQLVTMALGGSWNPLLFCGVAVAIQLTHDLLFGGVLVPAIPKGRNAIIDLMKDYAVSAPVGILAVDAIYMILASLLTMFFAGQRSGVSWMTLIVTLYATMYILFTRPLT